MTMGWMETIHFIGFDLQVATVFAVGSLDVGARALKSAWFRLLSDAPSLGSVRVTVRRLYAPAVKRWPIDASSSDTQNSETMQSVGK